MSGDNTARLIGGGAALAAALALIKGRAVAANSDTLQLDPATLKLLEAIGISVADIETLLEQILSSMGSLTPGDSSPGPIVQSPSGNYGVSQKYVRSNRVLCPVANTAVKMPAAVIPEGHFVMIKALWTNGGVIFVGGSAAVANPNDGWPLIANEFVGYRIQNLEEVYISANTPGEGVSWTCEQGTKGG